MEIVNKLLPSKGRIIATLPTKNSFCKKSLPFHYNYVKSNVSSYVCSITPRVCVWQADWQLSRYQR